VRDTTQQKEHDMKTPSTSIARLRQSLSVPDWRAGAARILDDDDPEERIRIIGRGDHWRRLRLQTAAAMNTNPLTVRKVLAG
jgi:hypothetical protein